MREQLHQAVAAISAAVQGPVGAVLAYLEAHAFVEALRDAALDAQQRVRQAKVRVGWRSGDVGRWVMCAAVRATPSSTHTRAAGTDWHGGGPFLNSSSSLAVAAGVVVAVSTVRPPGAAGSSSSSDGACAAGGPLRPPPHPAPPRTTCFQRPGACVWAVRCALCSVPGHVAHPHPQASLESAARMEGEALAIVQAAALERANIAAEAANLSAAAPQLLQQCAAWAQQHASTLGVLRCEARRARGATCAGPCAPQPPWLDPLARTQGGCVHPPTFSIACSASPLALAASALSPHPSSFFTPFLCPLAHFRSLLGVGLVV